MNKSSKRKDKNIMATKEQMAKEINDTIKTRLNLPTDVNYFTLA